MPLKCQGYKNFPRRAIEDYLRHFIGRWDCHDWFRQAIHLSSGW